MSQRKLMRDGLRQMVGRRVEELRKGKNMSRRQLAAHPHVRFSEDQLERIETGDKNLDLSDLTSLALGLDCEVIVDFKPRHNGTA